MEQQNKPKRTILTDEELMEILRPNKYRVLDEVAKEVGINPNTLKNRIEKLKKKGKVKTTYKFYRIITWVNSKEQSK
ncbi:MAG: winged helix-turn-helix transcriptional regulator [Nanoarchaeota archaeon]